MTRVFLAAGGAGFLLGLRYKVPALVAASGLTVLACIPFALLVDMGVLSVLLITFGLLGMLQVGYLGGALVGAWTGTPASPVDVSADTAVTRRLAPLRLPLFPCRQPWLAQPLVRDDSWRCRTSSRFSTRLYALAHSVFDICVPASQMLRQVVLLSLRAFLPVWFWRGGG